MFGSQYVLNGLVDKINAQIREELDSEITFIDTKHVIASIGISNAYSSKNKYDGIIRTVNRYLKKSVWKCITII